MARNALRTLGVVAGAAGFMIVAAIQLRAQSGGSGAGAAALPPPSAGLVALHMKFNGAASCNNADCHGAAKEKPNGDSFSNEYTLWSSEIEQQADPHHTKTWAALRNPTGKKIAQALGIAEATASDRCLSCHALNVPADLRGKDYRLNEGVTCNACHGPSERWLDPHSKKGWYQQQRAANDFQALLTKFGLYDTRPIHARAERCTSCHLAIEPDLVEKGHPQPTFELNFFSDTYPNRHWHDPAGYYKVKLWAGGQQVALQEALWQLASRAGAGGKPLQDAYNQAMAHWAMMSQILAGAQPAGGNPLSLAMQQVETAYAGNKSGLGPAATAAADADKSLADAIERFEPNKQNTLQMLNAIAGQADLATKYGKAAQDQQSYAIYALYAGYIDAIKPGSVAGGQDPVMNDIGAKLFPDMPLTTDQYVKNLAQIKGELPK